MEITRIAIDGLEMRIILFRNPQGVHNMYFVANEMEHEFVFRMGVADGKVELAGAYTFIIYNRVAFEYSSRSAVFADGHHRQGVLQTQACQASYMHVAEDGEMHVAVHVYQVAVSGLASSSIAEVERCGEFLFGIRGGDSDAQFIIGGDDGLELVLDFDLATMCHVL